MDFKFIAKLANDLDYFLFNLQPYKIYLK